MGIEGIEELAGETDPEAEERLQRMKQREQEAVEEHERRNQVKVEENRARQIRQGVISDTSEEAPQ